MSVLLEEKKKGEKKKKRVDKTERSSLKHKRRDDGNEKREKKKKRKKDRDHKEKRKRTDDPGGPVVNRSQEISIDDYYSLSKEFRVWLTVFKDKYFENLSTEEAKDIFEREFVKAFNKGKLPAMYYSGDIPVELQQRATHTRHNWNLAMNEQEVGSLRDVVEDVNAGTNAQL